MKNTLFFLFILFAFMGCEKEDDDTDIVCTANFTTISGHIITSNNVPLKGVKLQIKYIEKTGFHYSHSWLKRKAITDVNGFYSMSFNLKDSEIEKFEGYSSSYFELQVDLNNLDPHSYFLPEYISKTDSSYSTSSIISLKSNTKYTESLYIPIKDHITVSLKNFRPTQAGDHFEVQTFFPWGMKSDEKKMLNTEYGIISSGYDKFVTKSENQTFRVPVARNDTNIVRIVKVKNGVAYPEDHKFFVPKDNAIELTYEY